MKARFIKIVGSRVSLRRYWDGPCGELGYHNARKFIADYDDIHDTLPYIPTERYPDSEYPTKCDCCGAEAPETAKKTVDHNFRFNTESGKPEPGDLFYVNYLPDNFYWDNHKGPHLMAILPNGHEWNIDSRASNCTMKEDKTHRCWIRHGDPETGIVHVDKTGHTCNAGAGSIQSGNYHGYLDHGYFKQNRS